MLGEAEWEIMSIIWKEGRPLTSNFILDNLASRAWALSTLMTVLARLCKKGFLRCDRTTRANQYSALISGEEYREWEGREFLKRSYDSSIANMVSGLTKSGVISDEDIEELRNILRDDSFE